jgi:carbon-monoxide dehydrogenase medium subunit
MGPAEGVLATLITAEIHFHAATTSAEVPELFRRRHGEEAKLLGGALKLVKTTDLRATRPEILISLNNVAGLAYVEGRGAEVAIGRRTSHRAILQSKPTVQTCQVLGEACRHVGDVQVRKRGMVAGSVAHADPAADYLSVLVGRNLLRTRRNIAVCP